MAAPHASSWNLRNGLAALSTAIVALPQEVNYGLLSMAPLGAAFGPRGIIAALSGAFFGMCTGALAGNRFGQVLGSRPTLSLILAALAGGPLVQDALLLGDSAVALGLLFATVLLAGALQIVFGLLGVGRLIKYLPYPVLAGFMNGVAALIAISALRKIYGDGHVLSLLVLAVTLAVAIRPLKRGPSRHLPGALQAVLAGSLLHHLLVALCGASLLGATLPPLETMWPQFELERHLGEFLHAQLWLTLLPFSFAIAIIASLETLLAAATLDGITGERSDSNRELLAAGLGNLCSAVFGGTAVAGSMSRSNMLLRGGANSRLAMFAYAALLGLVLFAALPLIALLPQAVVAAVMLLIAWPMVNDWTRQLCRQVLLQRGRLPRGEQRELDNEFLVMLLVTVTAVFSDLKNAVLLGVLLALLLFVRRNTRSPVRRVYRGNHRRSLKWRGEREQQWLSEHGAAIVLLEAEGILFFGTVDRLSREIERLLDGTAYLILDCRRVVDIDATGARILQQVAQRLRRQGIVLLLANLAPTSHQARFLRSLGIEQDLPPAIFHADDESALEYAEDQLLAAALGILPQAEHVDISASSLGQGLPADELAALRDALVLHHYAAGETVFARGDAGRSLFIVRQGTVSIRLAVGATAKRLAAFGPGVVFGEMALLEGKPRSADAIADVPTELLELSAAAFADLSERQPALANHLLLNLGRILADRLRLTTADLRQALEA